MWRIVLGLWLYVVSLFAFIDDSGCVDTLLHLFTWDVCLVQSHTLSCGRRCSGSTRVSFPRHSATTFLVPSSVLSQWLNNKVLREDNQLNKYWNYDFYSTEGTPSWQHTLCKICTKERQKAYWEVEQETSTAREAHLHDNRLICKICSKRGLKRLLRSWPRTCLYIYPIWSPFLPYWANKWS